MATTAPAWGKPGAWALESEEQEAMEILKQQDAPLEPSAEFPSLAAAATTKISKKKKGQTLSLAEFNKASGKLQGLTHDERVMLPTAPRERTAEELELGNSRGFNNYYGGGRSRSNGGEDSASRWDSKVSDEGRRGANRDRDLAPSRADEVDDWGANKKSFERREKGGGFFESQAKADLQESWVSNKTAPLQENRRPGDGFRERRGFDLFNKDGGSDSWGRRKDEGERPRLKLQPRTLPIERNEGERSQILNEEVKSKGVNPFGAARPREEVLAEKGQDWKQIDERLESMKIREEGQSLSKKGFGLGAGNEPGERTERAWRKMEPEEPPSDDQRFV